MAGKKPPGVKYIEVQPSKDEDVQTPQNIGKSDNAIKPKIIANYNDSKFFPVRPARLPKIEKYFQEVEFTIPSHIQDMFAAKEAHEQDTKVVQLVKDECVEGKQGKKRKKKKLGKNKNRVLPVDDVNLRQACDDPELETSVGVDIKKKSKESKTKKPLKKKENEACSEIEEITTADDTENTNSTRKLPCLFGFVATWLAKRKEKRRNKKRKAIASRSSPQRLVEYDHRTAKGGEAFTVEVDNRPINLQKPLLPPIKQTPGPIRRQRLQSAVCRRAENLAHRQDTAREYDKKIARCKDRKAENDYQFRHKAELSIKQKQACAERNRDTRSRCKSRIVRTPSIESFNEPSAESSLGSIHGPSCYSEEEYERDVWEVDHEVDIPIF